MCRKIGPLNVQWLGILHAMGSMRLGRWREFMGRTAHVAAHANPRVGDNNPDALTLLRDFENSGQGWFWSTDAQCHLTYVSDGIANKLGVSTESLIGAPLLSLFNLEREDVDDGGERTLPLIVGTRKTFSDMIVRAAKDGDEIWWAISGRPQHDGSGAFEGYIGNGNDVTESRRTQRDASQLALYDSLTGLSNRHQITKRLTAILAVYKVAKRSCALFMIDLDRFKAVNDSLGHQAGDDLLKQVAQRLERVVEKNCEIGRLGGDEFQIIVPDMDDRGKLGDLAKTIISMISQPYTVGGSRCVIGASVGIAIAPFDGLDSGDLVRGADLALYAAKGGGRGQFRFYSSDLQTVANQRRRLEDELRDALDNGEISLAYQPVVSVTNNRVAGLEAVIRWQHPEYGMVPADQFLPIAEETKLIVSLGEWALRQACEDAAQWPANVHLAVNVSPTQFLTAGFPEIVENALAISGLDRRRLELELTESVFLSDTAINERMFADLKQLGVRLVLDDFGTGYSSLGYLRKAPFDKIKIDKSFVRGTTEPGNRNGAIISAIVSLTKALGLETTAEGIETLDELKLMDELGVSMIQGSLYSEPLPFAQVNEQISSGNWVIEPSGPRSQRCDRKTIFRKVGVIHEDHRYDVMMRNISRTGALIEGLLDVPVATQFVIDFGDGQLAVAVVRRSDGAFQGVEFETPLVDDGAGGLCTRHRISPYALAAAGMPANSGAQRNGQAPRLTMPQFAMLNDKAKRGKAA
jgi:diguanylate cyclase (GGDEF)-like protein/PAS domain S-box-containing protein